MAQAKFVTGSLMRHVSVMSFTASIGLVGLFMVDLIDMVFISMLGQKELAAAIGYAGSVLFFTTSIGIGLSIATGALVARSLGQGTPEVAKRYASNVLTIAFVVACIASAIVWTATPALITMLGAVGDTHDYAVEYLRIIIPSMPVIVMGMSAGAILRSHGDANRAMQTTLAGGAVNLVLDPIFIFTLGLGLSGAAYASVIARFAVLTFSLYYVFKHYDGLKRPELACLKRDVPAIFAIAGPAILTNVATPIGQAIVTRAISGYGDAAVAGMSIVGRLTPVSFAVIFALSGAIGPIVGQNFGAKNYDRVKGTLVAAIKFCSAYVISVSLLLFICRPFIADLFSATGEARELIYLFCGPLSLLFLFNGILFCANASFNNLNRPLYSTALNWLRNTIAMALPVWWLSGLWGSAGVLVGSYVGSIVIGSIAIWMGFRLADSYQSGDIDPGAPRQNYSWRRALSAFSRAGR